MPDDIATNEIGTVATMTLACHRNHGPDRRQASHLVLYSSKRGYKVSPFLKQPGADAVGPVHKERVHMTSMTRKPIGTRARTGETCPESGVWKAISTPSTTAPIAKGNRMPPYNGQAVSWELIRHA